MTLEHLAGRLTALVAAIARDWSRDPVSYIGLDQYTAARQLWLRQLQSL